MAWKGAYLHTKTDSGLVDLAKQGIRAAFDELLHRHRSRCKMLALALLRNPAEAEDGCQSAYWNAYVHLDQFRGDAQFSTWLLRITQNQCRMLIRARKHAAYVSLDHAENDNGKGPLEVRSRQPNPESALEKRELLNAVRFEITRLPPLLREALLMRDVQEIPIEETAKLMGITVGAVKSRLNRARRELRSRMQRYLPNADVE